MDTNRKKTAKRVVFAVIILLLAAILVALPFILESQQSESSKASLLSAKAEIGDISKTLSGTGTLTDEEAQEVSVPEGVLVTEYLVENGQFVNKGDPVARVDKVSVMETIYAMREKMESAAKEIESARSESANSTLTAPAAARVKAVYAVKGSSVEEVMLEHGALAVLSLDGLMSVSFDAEAPLSIGDSVRVVLPNEKKVTGRVDSVYGSTATVTIPDTNGSIGDVVQVLDKKDQLIGTGPLDVHSAWKVMATGGTVTGVYMKEGAAVYSGGTLLTIKSEGSEGYASLLSVYQVYEDELAELFRLYTDGVALAPCDGCVSGVDSSILTLLANSGAASGSIQFLVNTADRNLIMLLDDGDNSGAAGGSGNGDVQPTPAGTDPQGGDTPGGDNPGGETPAEGYACYLGMISSAEKSDDRKTVKVTAYLQKEPFITISDIQDLALLSSFYYGDIDTSPESMDIGNEYTFVLNDPVAAEAGDVYVFVDVNGTKVMMSFLVAHYDISGHGGGGGFGGGGGGFSGSMQDTVEETVKTARTVLLSVTPQDKVIVSITVDELDILSVRMGQDVQVTLDAMPGQSFKGVITDLNTTASNDGGNSKYSAVVELDRSAFMLGGMNASASITVEERPSVLLIPSAALAEENGQTVVYTALDPKTQKPSEPVPVEIGLSDGKNVQIISGIKSGDIVWYEYFDKLEVEGLFGKA